MNLRKSDWKDLPNRFHYVSFKLTQFTKFLKQENIKLS